MDLILIVDDNPNNLQVLGSILMQHELDTAFASNGPDAIQFAQTENPTLILLDVMMPEMDGYTVCKTLQSDPKTRDIPIIFLTARTDTDSILQGFESGAVDYVTKPFNGPELMARIHTHIELHNARYQLKAMNEEKNRLIGMASHDLKNMIYVIQSYSEFILDTWSVGHDAQEADFMRRIYDSAKAMNQLLVEWLDISKIESGQFEMIYTPVPFCAWLQDQLHTANILANRKGIQIKLHCPEADINILLDQAKISQVIANLISNAIKFSFPDTTITVEVQITAALLTVIVQDQGQGIPANELDQLFQPFHRTSVKPTGNEKSTGLGLVICKKIVEAHGGEISVSSVVKKGTAFTFSLPIKHA